MIFQKPILKSKIDIIDLVGYTVIISVVSAYSMYGACVIFGVVGNESKITLLDLVNGFAAIATASAFFLALAQYRKNIVQQRQQIIAVEAKSQIEKMINITTEIKTGEESCLDNLEHCLGLLSNIAIGFDELYRSMDEDIHRAIIRMQWQDMYYNNLSRSLERLDLVAILKKDSSIGQGELENAVEQARKYVEARNYIKTLKTCAFYEKLMASEPVKAKVDLKARLGSLDMFVMYYMNKYQTNDLMYGLFSQIDIRAHAPLLAVAGPSAFAFEDHRDDK